MRFFFGFLPKLQYLFLRRCQQADLAGQPLNLAEFTDDWLEQALLELGYTSTIRGRRNLLEGLEMHGLCTAIDYDRAKKVVAAPLVFNYVRQSVTSFDAWLTKLGTEIDREYSVWELTKLPQTAVERN
jgi:hypothetical protein